MTSEEDYIWNKWYEKRNEIIESIATWNEESVILWNGEDFEVVNDFGNTEYHYSGDYNSPIIEVLAIRNARETDPEDDFYCLLDMLGERGINITEDELSEEIRASMYPQDVASRYGIDYEDVITCAAIAEIADYLADMTDDIIARAININREIERWEEERY